MSTPSVSSRAVTLTVKLYNYLVDPYELRRILIRFGQMSEMGLSDSLSAPEIERALGEVNELIRDTARRLAPALEEPRAYWIDEEGDYVVLSGVREMEAALSSLGDLNGAVLKLYLLDLADMVKKREKLETGAGPFKPKKEKKERRKREKKLKREERRRSRDSKSYDHAATETERTTTSSTTASENASQQGEVHPHVTCDGCEGPVVGYRFKCLECPNYDLCERCEARKVHPQHDMLLLRKPRGHGPVMPFWALARQLGAHGAHHCGRARTQLQSAVNQLNTMLAPLGADLSVYAGNNSSPLAGPGVEQQAPRPPPPPHVPVQWLNGAWVPYTGPLPPAPTYPYPAPNAPAREATTATVPKATTSTPPEAPAARAEESANTTQKSRRELEVEETTSLNDLDDEIARIHLNEREREEAPRSSAVTSPRGVTSEVCPLVPLLPALTPSRPATEPVRVPAGPSGNAPVTNPTPANEVPAATNSQPAPSQNTERVYPQAPGMADSWDGGNQLINECMQHIIEMGFYDPLAAAQYGAPQRYDERKLHALCEAMEYNVNDVIGVLLIGRDEVDRVIREYLARRDGGQRSQWSNWLPNIFPR